MKRSGLHGGPLFASLMMVSAALGAAVGSGPQGVIEHDRRTGKVRLEAHGPPIRFEVDRLCRYDLESHRWSRVGFAPASEVVGDGVVAELPGSVGLYWVRWRENGRPFSSLAASGPVSCNDIPLAPSPRAGEIAACVPLPTSALATYVPDPAIDCARP